VSPFCLEIYIYIHMERELDNLTRSTDGPCVTDYVSFEGLINLNSSVN
jgi:hypothetical protein